MGQRTYSNDLRSRVVAEVADGTSRRQAARLFRVSASSAVRWVERHEATGSVSAHPRGGKSRSPLEPYRDWLLRLVAQEPTRGGRPRARQLGLVDRHLGEGAAGKAMPLVEGHRGVVAAHALEHSAAKLEHILRV